MVKVAGPDNLLVYSGKEVDAVYWGSQAAAKVRFVLVSFDNERDTPAVLPSIASSTNRLRTGRSCAARRTMSWN